MTDFKKNRKYYYAHGLFLKLGAVALLAFLIFLVISDVKLYFKKRQLNLQIHTLQNKIEDAKKQNEALAESIENADNKDYIEKVAREELDLQKPGETVISFIEKEDKNAQKKDISGGMWQSFLGSISGVWNFLNPF